MDRHLEFGWADWLEGELFFKKTVLRMERPMSNEPTALDELELRMRPEVCAWKSLVAQATATDFRPTKSGVCLPSTARTYLVRMKVLEIPPSGSFVHPTAWIRPNFRLGTWIVNFQVHPRERASLH